MTDDSGAPIVHFGFAVGIVAVAIFALTFAPGSRGGLGKPAGSTHDGKNGRVTRTASIPAHAHIQADFPRLAQGVDPQIAQRIEPNRRQRPDRTRPVLSLRSELLPVQREHLVHKCLAPQRHPVAHVPHPHPQHLAGLPQLAPGLGVKLMTFDRRAGGFFVSPTLPVGTMVVSRDPYLL